MAEKKYFTQNTEKKVITIDTTVKPTQADKDMVQMLLAAGYKLRQKSQKRAENARARAQKNGFGKKKEEAKQ